MENQNPEAVRNNLAAGKMERARRIGWMVAAFLALALALGGLKGGMEAVRQARGVKGLLQAGADASGGEGNNPFVCLREAGNSGKASAALADISDEYLRGVGLCMAGESGAGMEALRGAGEQANASVQYAGAITRKDAQAGLKELAKLGLSDDLLAAILINLSAQEGVDTYTILRESARRDNERRETWSAWLQGSRRLEAEKKWQEAVEWIKEGLAMAPRKVRSSLYLQEGRIYQTQAEPPDYQSALAAYNQAIQQGGWMNPAEMVNVHIFRGEVYRALKDGYTPDMVLGEFQKALELQPEQYWALLEMGYVYQYDLKNADKAEGYYRQALEADENSPYAYYYLGEVYRERGDIGTAAEWYRKALEHQPDFQPARERLNKLEENGGG